MLTRREFMQTAALAAGGVAIGACAQLKEMGRGKKKPNLLFVFSDQQSRDMVGCYGNRDIITPNLDKFASQGTQFNHCVSSSPVCTPFRAMLFSGQHPLRCGAIHNDYPLLANNGRYFGHVLRDAGYRTAYVGKWHLLGGDRNRPVPAGPMRYGFDEVFQSNNCHVNFAPGKCFYWTEKGEKSFFPEWEVFGQTRQALNFLDTCTSDEPFAMFVSWHPPHDVGIFPDSLVFRYETIPELMQLYDPEKITLRPSAPDTPAVRKAYHGYYAMCSGVDQAFGWLTDKLAEKGLADDTIVVFTSDHGDNLHSYGYTIAKDHPEDTAAGIPFLMRWSKGLPQPRTSNLLLGAMDIMPTLLGLMGLDVPDTVQGQDLSGAIHRQDDDAVDSVPLFFFKPSWRGVYTRDVTYGRGKIAHFTRKEGGGVGLKTLPLEALYDRRTDPDQLNNLYGKPDAKGLQEKMEKLTRKWMARFDDPGVGYEEIDPLYQRPDGTFPEDTQETGFRGAPVDLLKRKA